MPKQSSSRAAIPRPDHLASSPDTGKADVACRATAELSTPVAKRLSGKTGAPGQSRLLPPGPRRRPATLRGHPRHASDAVCVESAGSPGLRHALRNPSRVVRGPHPPASEANQHMLRWAAEPSTGRDHGFVVQTGDDRLGALHAAAVDALAGKVVLGAALLEASRARSDRCLAGRVDRAEYAAQVGSHRFQEHESLVDRGSLGAEDAAAAGTPLAEDLAVDQWKPGHGHREGGNLTCSLPRGATQALADPEGPGPRQGR
jgi:hypothetical protein